MHGETSTVNVVSETANHAPATSPSVHRSGFIKTGVVLAVLTALSTAGYNFVRSGADSADAKKVKRAVARSLEDAMQKAQEGSDEKIDGVRIAEEAQARMQKFDGHIIACLECKTSEKDPLVALLTRVLTGEKLTGAKLVEACESLPPDIKMHIGEIARMTAMTPELAQGLLPTVCENMPQETIMEKAAHAFVPPSHPTLSNPEEMKKIADEFLSLAPPEQYESHSMIANSKTIPTPLP